MPLLLKMRYLFLGAVLVSLEHPIIYRLFHNLKFHWRGRFTDDDAEFKPKLGPYYLNTMAEWQAVILLPQMRRLEGIIATRQRLYADYRRRLQGAKSFALPAADPLREWAPIRFPILIHKDKLQFYRRAAARGIDFAFSFTFLASPGEFTRSRQIAASILDIPFYDRLSENELDRVVAVLLELDRTSVAN